MIRLNLIKSKVCSTCKVNKPFRDYGKKKRGLHGFKSECHPCEARKQVEWSQIKKSLGLCADCGLVSIGKYRCDKCKEKHNLSDREKSKTPEGLKYRREYVKNRKKVDLNFKLKCLLRTRIYLAVRRKKKVGSAVKDLGCSVEELKLHLESQFQSGMTWENHGIGNKHWQIDHIIPLASVDLTDREQFLKVCHYTNLRPLWMLDNMKRRTFDSPRKELECLV